MHLRQTGGPIWRRTSLQRAKDSGRAYFFFDLSFFFFIFSLSLFLRLPWSLFAMCGSSPGPMPAAQVDPEMKSG